jgi:hypothetical protein
MDTVIGDCDSASSGEGERMQRCQRFAIRTVLSAVAEAVRVPTYTCNDTCIALSGRVQRHLYFDLLGRSAWSLTSVAGIAGHHRDVVF